MHGGYIKIATHAAAVLDRAGGAECNGMAGACHVPAARCYRFQDEVQSHCGLLLDQLVQLEPVHLSLCTTQMQISGLLMKKHMYC